MPSGLESVLTDQLRPCKVCRGLDEEQLARVAESCSPRQLEPGETLTQPGDSKSSVYTVIRGRLKMFHVSVDEERFIGYVNQGDTVGQFSFFLEDFATEIRIVADIESYVAVLSHQQTRILIFEIPRFRKNLIESFGARAANVLRGTNPRRFPKIVGVVSGSNKSREFLPALCRELSGWNETICVFTNRPDQFAASENVQFMAIGHEHEQRADLRTRILDQLAGTKRILLDICQPISADPTFILGSDCEEILWCCDNDSPNENHEAMLAKLVAKYPEWKSRIICVQILAKGSTLGRRRPCCSRLMHRDFLLPLDREANKPTRLFQHGSERIVRHLRGIKIGLALGGGGARGMAHLGVLRELDNEGINFDVMSGTSVGAMVGLGYAAGLSPNYLIDAYSTELKPSRLLDRLPGGRRLFLFEKFRARAWEKMLRRHYHDLTFEQLPIPFSVAVTDLVSGEVIVRDSGDIVQAILETINVPVLAKPILRDGKILVDGGVLNNLPVDLLNECGTEYVVGVDVSKDIPNHFVGNFSDTPTNRMKKPSGFETAYRVMDVSRRGTSRLQMSFADLAIEPDTSAFDFADFTAAAAIAETGAAATKKMLPEISAAMSDLRQN